MIKNIPVKKSIVVGLAWVLIALGFLGAVLSLSDNRENLRLNFDLSSLYGPSVFFVFFLFLVFMLRVLTAAK